MRFDFFGMLRQTTGHKTLTINLPPGATLGEALEALFAAHPLLREVMLDEAARLRPEQPAFLNGRNVRLYPNYLAHPLEAADVVSLFTPIASGRMNVEVLREPAFGKRSHP